jgi:hypothetical protein
MAVEISLKDQFTWVSNMRHLTLLDFGIDVGASIAREEDERAFVEGLKQFSASPDAALAFDLEAVFPTISEKKWWARVYSLVARRIYLRQLGNQEDQRWQPSTIGDAYVIARMLTRAVQEVELGWHPVLDDPAEAEGFAGGGIRVRF